MELVVGGYGWQGNYLLVLLHRGHWNGVNGLRIDRPRWFSQRESVRSSGGPPVDRVPMGRYQRLQTKTRSRNSGRSRQRPADLRHEWSRGCIGGFVPWLLQGALE